MISILSFTNKYNDKTKRVMLVLHPYLSFLEEADGSCIINDEKIGHSYYTVETFHQIHMKLVSITNLR